jgi:hypothetical protein
MSQPETTSEPRKKKKRKRNAKKPLRLGTVKAACQVIGGDKPVDPATYYRGVRRGIYPPPFRTSLNISRVDLDALEAAIRARADGDSAA